METPHRGDMDPDQEHVCSHYQTNQKWRNYLGGGLGQV